MHSKPHFYALLLRFFIVGIAWLIITYLWGEHLIEALIPLYEWVIKQMDYRFDTVLLSVIEQHQEQFLTLETTLSQPFIHGANIISPSFAIPSGASMPIGNVMLPVVLIFTCILAWPLPDANKRQMLKIYLTRLGLALPFTLLIMLLDMPIQLLKIVWEGLNKQLDLNMSNHFQYVSYWSDFLNGGGLMALSITAGILIVGITKMTHAKN